MLVSLSLNDSGSENRLMSEHSDLAIGSESLKLRSNCQLLEGVLGLGLGDRDSVSLSKLNDKWPSLHL